jgi:hypothetical protein
VRKEESSACGEEKYLQSGNQQESTIMSKERVPNTRVRTSYKRAKLAEDPDSYSLFDENDWQVFLDPTVIRKDPDAFARLLFKLKAAIESGPSGIERVHFTLIEGIWRALNKSRTRQAVIKLYGAFLGGHLKPEDEPGPLIDAAISRGQASTDSSLVAGGSIESKRVRKKQ